MKAKVTGVWTRMRRRKQRGPAERRHGDEAQGGPAVEVAAAWFTLCGRGGNIGTRRGSGGGAGAQCGGVVGTQWPNTAAVAVARKLRRMTRVAGQAGDRRCRASWN